MCSSLNENCLNLLSPDEREIKENLSCQFGKSSGNFSLHFLIPVGSMTRLSLKFATHSGHVCSGQGIHLVDYSESVEGVVRAALAFCFKLGGMAAIS